MSMNYGEFQRAFADGIVDRLPEDQKNANVRIGMNRKLNQSYNGLTVHQEGDPVAATVNLDRMFDRYEAGEDFENLVDEAMGMIQMEKPDFDIAKLMDYDSVKDQLFIRVSNAEMNADSLENVPYIMQSDLAVTFHVMVDAEMDGVGSVMVTDSMMNQYGVDFDTLVQNAMASAPNVMPVKVENMADMMSEIFRNDMLAEGMSPQEAEAMLEMMHADQVPLTVVTNEMKVNGASALFYPEVMDQLAEKIGGNFFILPSSVHESLVLPDDGSQSIGDLKAMVMEVNATQVDPVDRLSDDVYHYDAQDKVFEKAQDFESRMAEKVAVKDADRKPSLHQKLETKKQESKEQEPKMPKAEKHRSNDAEL